jgi:N-succinyldiaminopimelate aminotransferase
VNPKLQHLRPYPFERLRALLAGTRPPAHFSPISLSIGEPRHAAPDFLLAALRESLESLGTYPTTLGTPEFRSASANWLERRFALPRNCVDRGTMVLPVNGTREALFAFTQALIDTSKDARPLVLAPNPFYQIYEGAAILAGADVHFLPTLAKTRYLPDLDAVSPEVWKRCQLLFLCSPGNPTGAVMGIEYLKQALEFSDKYGFAIAADECYADIYFDEAAPPPSLLQACIAHGRPGFDRCIAFHSLSKRSSVPGLRSGFVAGDPQLLKSFLLYRTYHGCAMPVHVQTASVAAWNEDEHARANRSLYREKFDAILPVLSTVMAVHRPDAAFYLWPDVDGDDEIFVRDLFAQKNVLALPGSYLARGADGVNPGAGRIRVSLVAPLAECVEAAGRIRDFVISR